MVQIEINDPDESCQYDSSGKRGHVNDGQTLITNMDISKHRKYQFQVTGRKM